LEEGIVVDESTLAGCVEDIHTLTSGLSLSQAVMGMGREREKGKGREGPGKGEERDREEKGKWKGRVCPGRVLRNMHALTNKLLARKEVVNEKGRSKRR
jgi:hypothetical protein